MQQQEFCQVFWWHLFYIGWMPYQEWKMCYVCKAYMIVFVSQKSFFKKKNEIRVFVKQHSVTFKYISTWKTLNDLGPHLLQPDSVHHGHSTRLDVLGIYPHKDHDGRLKPKEDMVKSNQVQILFAYT